MQYNSKAYTAYSTLENSKTHITDNSIHAVAPSLALQERGLFDKSEMVERTGYEAYYKCGGGLDWGWFS